MSSGNCGSHKFKTVSFKYQEKEHTHTHLKKGNAKEVRNPPRIQKQNCIIRSMYLPYVLDYHGVCTGAKK